MIKEYELDLSVETLSEIFEDYFANCYFEGDIKNLYEKLENKLIEVTCDAFDKCDEPDREIDYVEDVEIIKFEDGTVKEHVVDIKILFLERFIMDKVIHIHSLSDDIRNLLQTLLFTIDKEYRNGYNNGIDIKDIIYVRRLHFKD